MKKTEHCSTKNVKDETGCHITKGIQIVQPFPTSGLLAENLNLKLAELESRNGRIRGTARSYIVDTVKMRSDQMGLPKVGLASTP